jgi:hypothetical protein
MIRYQCAECGAVLNIKDELAGAQGHCPRCQVEFTVPAAEGSLVSEKKPAAVAGEPAVKERDRSGGAFSEDDIGDILAAGGPVSSPADARGSDNAFDQEEEEVEEEPSPKRSRAKIAEADEQAKPDEDEDHAARSRKKDKTAVKPDSAESAAIAKNLMARGDHAAVRDDKKGGRPFGGAEGRAEERPDYTTRDMLKYFASIGWPAVAGMVVLLGLSIAIYKWLSPGINLPPLAEVSGTVTLDGKPLENAIVQFQPVTEGPRPNLNLATSIGITDKDGKYRLVYIVIEEKQIYGAVIGMHGIVIKATDKEGNDVIPPEYGSFSKTLVRKEVVKGGLPIDFPLISPPKPAQQ